MNIPRTQLIFFLNKKIIVFFIFYVTFRNKTNKFDTNQQNIYLFEVLTIAVEVLTL